MSPEEHRRDYDVDVVPQAEWCLFACSPSGGEQGGADVPPPPLIGRGAESGEHNGDEQFVRHYPVTPTPQIEGGGLSLVDDTEMAGLSWGYEQGEEMGTLQEHHGELGFLGGEEWGSE